MDNNAQGALEYLLLIGGAVLVAVIVITLLLGLTDSSQEQAEANTSQGIQKICFERLKAICDPADAGDEAQITSACTLDPATTTCPVFT